MNGLFRHFTRTLNRASGSVIVRTFLNARLQETAQVLKLNIDPEQQFIEAEVQLKDQPGPLRIRIEGYELRSSDDGHDQLSWSKITLDEGAVNLPPGIRDKLSYIM